MRTQISSSGAEPARYDYSQQVGHLLRKAYQRHLAIFQDGTAASGLTSVQFSILCALHDHGPSSQADLVRASAIDQATIRGILQRLRDRGLIMLDMDAADRRKIIYDLTQRGRALARETMPRALEISQETLRSLNPAEAVALLFLLRKIVES